MAWRGSWSVIVLWSSWTFAILCSLVIHKVFNINYMLYFSNPPLGGRWISCAPKVRSKIRSRRNLSAWFHDSRVKLLSTNLDTMAIAFNCLKSSGVSRIWRSIRSNGFSYELCWIFIFYWFIGNEICLYERFCEVPKICMEGMRNRGSWRVWVELEQDQWTRVI